MVTDAHETGSGDDVDCSDLILDETAADNTGITESSEKKVDRNDDEGDESMVGSPESETISAADNNKVMKDLL